MSGLVADYSSSEEDDTEVVRPAPKKPKLLLPNTIKDLQFGPKPTDEPDPNDTAEQHDGRIRSFGHERGNWATYVFIDFPDRHDAIRRLQDAMCQHFSDAALDFRRTDHLHMSLTRTLVLKHHWIDAFVESVKECIPKHRRFPLRLRDINVYCNDERTRTFVALLLAPDDRAPVQRCVADLDGVLREFRLPAFYAETSYHVSILWCLGDQQKRILREHAELLALLNEHIAGSMAHEANEADDDDGDAFAINAVANIDCKIGNKFYTFALT